MPRTRRSTSRALVWIAAVAGAIHAGFSLYWAAGGRWLLRTVGQWAVDLADDAPVRAGLVLGLIAVVKLLGAAIPVAVTYGWVGRRRLWRGLSWVGGSALVGYGAVNTGIALAVLGGAIRPDGGYDRTAMIGHAYLWDPLFLIWGAALVASLWLSRLMSVDGTPPTASD